MHLRVSSFLVALLAACKSAVAAPLERKGDGVGELPTYVISAADRRAEVRWEALDARLADASVVLLGEQSHGDGETFALKVDLVQYLHERHDFDVLVFESSFYGCDAAWSRIRAGTPVVEAMRECLFSVWWCSAELDPLFAYIDSNKDAARPLHIAGMDPQLVVPVHERLLRDLSTWAPRAVVEQVGRMLEKTRELSDRDVFLRTRDAAAVRQLLQRAQQNGSEFWERVVSGLAFIEEDAWSYQTHRAVTPEMLGFRSAEMAENVLWLLQHEQRKVVVWMASLHAALDGAFRFADGAGRRSRSAGEILSNHLGNRVVSVGFLAAEGQFGSASSDERERTPPVLPDSLEHELAMTGTHYAVIDLDAVHGSRVAGFFGYSPAVADWHRVFDFAIFSKTMTPASRSPRCP